MAASALPHELGDLSGIQFSPKHSPGPRSRTPGRPNPSGTKLARKALRGTIGRATIR